MLRDSHYHHVLLGMSGIHLVLVNSSSSQFEIMETGTAVTEIKNIEKGVASGESTNDFCSNNLIDSTMWPILISKSP
jgi:hypothetical protein